MSIPTFFLRTGFVVLLGQCVSILRAAEPDFGPNVLIFSPATAGIQQKVDAIYSKQERAEFGPDRHAFLFKPGNYDLDIQAGFYTQIIGLGQSPDDVVITGAVRSTAGWMKGNATVNFWRSAENLAVIPKRKRANSDVWAVSQGTWLRRIHIQGDMNLWDGGWSSGGFLADSKIDGKLVSGSQQQWISRNSQWGQWNGGVWNMVFVGDTNLPEGHWPAQPYTMIERTPAFREKPYLAISAGGEYSVMVPPMNADETQGITWPNAASAAKAIPLDQFYLAHAEKDTAATINAALSSGKHLLLTPGVYHLSESIHITRPDTIVLGLGYPTLIPTTAQATIRVDDVDGVKICGIILDAGKVETPALLQMGDGKTPVLHAGNPSCIYDLVARAGGAEAGITSSFVTIHSNNVIGDNCWLWRADHGNGAGWNSNKVKNGLVVNGDDVTFFGLFVEHCQQYQTLWNGNGGKVYFYQSELPYDPPNQAMWSHDGVNGYASYKVADTVTSHEAYGLGIYSYFTAAPVVEDNAIETPSNPEIKMRDMVIIRLGGKPGSQISHVINGRGAGKMSVTPVRVSD